MTTTLQHINTGTSANKGDGDSLRLAFHKVNKNFEALNITSGVNADDVKDLVWETFQEQSYNEGIEYQYIPNTHQIHSFLIPATANAIGGVKIGSGITVAPDGTISASTGYTLPAASSSVLGGVRIGTGITIDGNAKINNSGVLSFNTRVGAVSLTSGDISGALGYTPANAGTLAQPNGIATLDAGGKVPLSQIADSVLGALNYQGTWNAQTNVPPLQNGVGTKGYYYKVSINGTHTLDGISEWYAGDLVVFNGTFWDKVDGVPSEVLSVAGRTGAVTLTYADIGGVIPRTAFSTTNTATNTSYGIVKIGNGIIASGDGTIGVDTTQITPATTTKLGLIKVGNGLAITVDGTLSTTLGTDTTVLLTANTITNSVLNQTIDLRPTNSALNIYNYIITHSGNNNYVLRTSQFLNAGLATDSTNFSLRIVGDSNSGSNLFDAGVYSSPIGTAGWTSKFNVKKTGDVTMQGNLEVKGTNGIKFSDGSVQTTAAVIVTATNATVGGIIVGNDFTIDGTGILALAQGITGGTINSRGPSTVASSTDPGSPGEITWDGTYWYLCVDINTWMRMPWISPNDIPGQW
jgi:hypothetical protein